MTRSKSLTVAVILQFLLGVLDAILSIPILAAGGNGLPPQPGMALASMGGPPFFMGVVFLILAVASLFGAYGLWMNQKRGKALTIITRVITGLFGLGDILGAIFLHQLGAAFGMAVYLLVSILVIVLVLRREPKPVLA